MLVLAAGCGGGPTEKPEILVGVAASLQPLFAEIAPAFEAANDVRVTLVPGSSEALAQQIRAGAPIDAFASADPSHANLFTSDGKNLVLDGRAFAFAEGRVVLVTTIQGAQGMSWLEVLAGPQVQHIAMANPELAPYGERARAALGAAEVWDGVADRVVYGANVAQALEFVRSGNAQAGFVALSQVQAGLANGLSVHPVDHCLHGWLNQVLIGIEGTDQRELVEAFIAFVGGEEAGAAILRLGYAPAAGRLGRPECGEGP